MIELNSEEYGEIKYVPEDLADVYYMHVRDNVDDPICPKCGAKGLDTNKEVPDGVPYYSYMETNAYRILRDKIERDTPQILSEDAEEGTDPIVYGAIYLYNDLIDEYDSFINDVFCECKNYWSAITGKVHSYYSEYLYDTPSNMAGKRLPLGTKLLLRERKMHFIKRHYKCNCCGKEWDSNPQLDLRYYNPNNVSMTKWK